MSSLDLDEPVPLTPYMHFGLSLRFPVARKFPEFPGAKREDIVRSQNLLCGPNLVEITITFKPSEIDRFARFANV